MLESVPYTQFSFWLNAQIDAGLTADPSEVERRIGDGSLFDWLYTAFASPGAFRLNEDDQAEVWERIESIAAVYSAKSKFAASRNGFCVLQAYCIEAIQQVARSQDRLAIA